MTENKKIVSYQCPSCGHPVPVGSPICPGCHRIFTQEDIGKYSAEIAKTEANLESKKHETKTTIKVLIGIVIFLVLDIIFMLSMGARDRGIRNTDNAKLEAIYQEVEQAILDEDYDIAMLRALSIQPDPSLDEDYRKKWDDRRNEVIKLIEQKQKGK